MCMSAYICASTHHNTSTHHDTLHPTTTHCNPLQPTATHCNPLQPTAAQPNVYVRIHLRHALWQNMNVVYEYAFWGHDSHVWICILRHPHILICILRTWLTHRSERSHTFNKTPKIRIQCECSIWLCILRTWFRHPSENCMRTFGVLSYFAMVFEYICVWGHYSDITRNVRIHMRRAPWRKRNENAHKYAFEEWECT